MKEVPHCIVIGTGQIGTFSIRALSAAGWRVTAADLSPRPGFLLRFSRTRITASVLDVTDRASVEAFVASAGRCEAIVFSAGTTGPNALSDIETATHVLLEGSRNMAHAARVAGIPRLVAVSSLAVYGPGQNDTLTLPEEQPFDSPVGPYGQMIRKLEAALLDEQGLSIMILRLAGVFGPYRIGYGSHSSQLVFRMLHSAVQNGQIKLRGYSEDCDDFIYARDVGRAVAAAASLPGNSHEVINVGTGTTTTMRQLINAVEAVVGPLQHRISPPDPSRAPIHRPPLDVTRMACRLGPHEFELTEALGDFACETKLALPARRGDFSAQ